MNMPFVKVVVVMLAVVTMSVLSVKALVKGDANEADESSSSSSKSSDEVESAFKQGDDDSKNTEDWMLKLVNKDNALPKDFVPELEHVENGYYFDSRATRNLQEMLEAARAEGQNIIMCSAYRSIQTQQQLYDNEVLEQQAQGFSYEEACEEAKTIVAYPGTSEHNLGLAVDIVAVDYQILDENQQQRPENIWLQENCYKYGFIVRYPVGKTDLTGVIFEPWHFRYVGVDVATEIHSQNICLEEYLS